MSEEKIVRVGSRKSELALIQTRHVISLLEHEYPDKKFEIVTMNTLGDNVLDIPLPKIGEKSLFTKELETALSIGSVDFVVHSLKDLPTTLPDGMVIGAILTREDPRDALVLSKKYRKYELSTLPTGSVIGTSSLRRSAQLCRNYPNLIVENIRGNLNTRLKKLDELDKYSAIILAAAGLNRIGWQHRISQILEPEELMYAVGQGALAVECRENDNEIIDLLSPLYESATALQVLAERSFLKTLGGGCSAPVAVTSDLLSKTEDTSHLSLKGGVWSLDGQINIVHSLALKLPYKQNKRCENGLNKIDSIELSDSSVTNCIDSKSCSSLAEDEVPRKKQKLEEVSSQLLENDPHDLCPVQMPVGSDFMGKCPFLESSPVSAKKLLIDIEKQLPTKCPFSSIQETVSTSKQEISSSSKNNNYCGIVLHKSVEKNVFEMVELLGQNLAESLIKKGALEVMEKARAVIHG
ncbi:hypothetical protein WA026_010627 [Henosepilachna vigintioctopunctata]|uniref:hydroxymethylbilane synthase n=1 Tax=Henosepilachna vigintioctopunctata TaxID=420089 RepID=A0AAW1VDQ7_9CUCU